MFEAALMSKDKEKILAELVDDLNRLYRKHMDTLLWGGDTSHSGRVEIAGDGYKFEAILGRLREQGKREAYRWQGIVLDMDDSFGPTKNEKKLSPKTIPEAALRLLDLKTKLEPNAVMSFPAWVIDQICENEGQDRDYVQRSLTSLSGAISTWDWKGKNLMFTIYRPHSD